MNISEFSKILKERSLAPLNIQFAEWNEWTLVSCFDENNNNFISESVSMGIDKKPHTALMKALTEFCERRVFKTSNDESMLLTERSDGVAAIPAHYLDAEELTRRNALNEASERYLWSTWWDNLDTKYFIEPYQFHEAELLKKEFDLKRISKIIIPSRNSDIYLTIILAENNKGGFITGGAAGSDLEIPQTHNRALGELLRHLIVTKNISKNGNISDMSFYEKRLWGFASGTWSEIVKKRLQKKGNELINLPHLSVDKKIPHQNSDVILVHRCLFHNQPIFMGGELERLCI